MSNSMWPSMRELKQAAGDGPCFVARLVRQTKPEDMYPGSPKHEEVCLSGPLDVDLFEKLRAAVMDVWNEQLSRARSIPVPAPPAGPDEGAR